MKVLCLGLEGAGKSAFLAVLAGEPAEVTEPTVGEWLWGRDMTATHIYHTPL